MQSTGRGTLFALFIAAVACHSGDSDADVRARLTDVLRDSLGRTADPNVAFMADGNNRGSHLYVAFDTTAVPNVSDAVFDSRARDLARFAVRHYERASNLDSITVATRERLQPGIWRVHHRRSFAMADLNEPRR
jgi:hypothetical protein